MKKSDDISNLEARISTLESEVEERKRLWVEAMDEAQARKDRAYSLRSIADGLAEAAQECLEERESYWGSEDSVRKNQIEYAALYDAIAAYRSHKKE